MQDRDRRVDGVSWEHYAQELEEKLQDLHARGHRGAYRALVTVPIAMDDPVFAPVVAAFHEAGVGCEHPVVALSVDPWRGQEP